MTVFYGLRRSPDAGLPCLAILLFPIYNGGRMYPMKSSVGGVLTNRNNDDFICMRLVWRGYLCVNHLGYCGIVGMYDFAVALE